MNDANLSIFRPSSLLDPFSSYLHGAAASTMPVDIEDADREWRIKADLPGISKQDVRIKLDNDILSISASHDSQRQDSPGADGSGRVRYLIAERSTGSVERKFRLAGGIDNGAINASLKDGVLTVTVPKPDSSRNGKEIDIN